MDDPSVIYLCVAAGCAALFFAVLIVATLADRWRERKIHPGRRRQQTPFRCLMNKMTRVLRMFVKSALIPN
jgi:hypothetical protein